MELLGDAQTVGGGLAADGVPVADGDAEQVGQPRRRLVEAGDGVAAGAAVVAGGGVDDGHHVAVGDDRHRRHRPQRLQDGQVPEVGGDGRVGHVVGDEDGLAQRHDLPAEPLAGADPDLAEDGVVAAAHHAVHGEQAGLLADGDAGERHPHGGVERLGACWARASGSMTCGRERAPHRLQPGGPDRLRGPRDE